MIRFYSADLDSLQFVVDVDIPKLRIEAQYHIDGKLLMVPVKGDGNLETNVSEFDTQNVKRQKCQFFFFWQLTSVPGPYCTER